MTLCLWTKLFLHPCCCSCLYWPISVRTRSQARSVTFTEAKKLLDREISFLVHLPQLVMCLLCIHWQISCSMKTKKTCMSCHTLPSRNFLLHQSFLYILTMQDQSCCQYPAATKAGATSWKWGLAGGTPTHLGTFKSSMHPPALQRPSCARPRPTAMPGHLLPVPHHCPNIKTSFLHAQATQASLQVLHPTTVQDLKSFNKPYLFFSKRK